jgi:uncharacterized protein (DUF1697 family)
MRYIALLRGINVGGNRKVEMKQLKALYEGLGYAKVSTYINSGNILFTSLKRAEVILKEITIAQEKKFGFEIPTLVKTQKEMKKIAVAIPKNWQNNDQQKTDVAYLFKEIDTKEIIDDLPVKKEFLTIKYVKGALIWNVRRVNYNKSHLNKIISHKLYKLMTLRNVNTARLLANI